MTGLAAGSECQSQNTGWRGVSVNARPVPARSSRVIAAPRVMASQDMREAAALHALVHFPQSRRHFAAEQLDVLHRVLVAQEPALPEE